jgi:hypothetical protein
MDSLQRLINSAPRLPALTGAAGVATGADEAEAEVRAAARRVASLTGGADFGLAPKRPVLSGFLGGGAKNKHLSGQFCLGGDTMEGIIQCLVFLKAFSVRQLI